MRYILLLIVFFAGWSTVCYAQAPNMYMGSEQQPIRIRTGAVFQQYADEDRRLSQLTFPVSAFIPFTRNLAFSLYTNPTLISGEAVTSLEGLSDAQVALSFYQEIGEGSIVVSLGSNVPSGKRELTEDEFATTALVSQDFYGFYVPVLGQGLNISPGITVAYPLGDNVVGGVGFSYQLKGSFKPVVNMIDSFTPGNEMMITGGFDFRLADSWALSTNVSYVMYQADELGSTSVFESGAQTVAVLQVLGNVGGSNQMRVIARYRTKAKSTLPAGDQFITAPRTIPEQFQVLGSYTLSIQENLNASLIGRVRHYQDTDFFATKTLFDVGASPEVAFSESVSAVMRFVYTFGSFPGVEIGGGLAFSL
ncbi:MAG: hypothetical protein AB8G77_16675 [Rhodothermales bacterium]